MYMGQKRKAKENVLSLIYEKGEMATTDLEKVEVLNKHFSSVFMGSQAFHTSEVPELLDRCWERKIPLTAKKEQV